MALTCFIGYLSAVFPSHLLYFTPRMESLDTALQIVLPVEKESLLLCGSDLLHLHNVAIQEFHLTDADGIYQRLRVNIRSHSIVIQ